jgi:pyruvate/2-oxoglutarate dehydrogenase complex dihydrolipoamide acyltransferase (E2) component
MKRLAVLLCVFLVWAPAAYAWSWPVQGPVVQPFAYDESHPYASGQHRGVDIGADAAGETVVAPAAGTVSFAGSVPTNGKSVTIETADGYSVTLTHLGSIVVAEGATVAEQQAVGTVGPSGTPEVDGPYVHLGIRLTADPNGYVDPLSLLPPVPQSSTSQSGSTGTQTGSTGAASAPAAKKPAASAPPRPRVATATRARTDVSSGKHGRSQEPRTDAQPRSSSQRTASREVRTPLESRTPSSEPSELTSSIRRPLEEPASLDAGLEPRSSAHVAQPRRQPFSPLPALVCDWAAALFAIGAAFAARRRRSGACPTARAQVLRLQPPSAERKVVSRAA